MALGSAMVAMRIDDICTDSAQKCLFLLQLSNLWTRLIFKRLYVEHVIIPSPINPERGQRKAYKLLSLIKVKLYYDTVELLISHILDIPLLSKLLSST